MQAMTRQPGVPPTRAEWSSPLLIRQTRALKTGSQLHSFVLRGSLVPWGVWVFCLAVSDNGEAGDPAGPGMIRNNSQM